MGETNYINLDSDEEVEDSAANDRASTANINPPEETICATVNENVGQELQSYERVLIKRLSAIGNCKKMEPTILKYMNLVLMGSCQL